MTLSIKDLPVTSWMSGSSMSFYAVCTPSLPHFVSTGSIQGHIGSLGGYGSRGHFVAFDRTRSNALHHYENLRLEHLKRDEIVDLYVKCVELLAGSPTPSEE